MLEFGYREGTIHFGNNSSFEVTWTEHKSKNKVPTLGIRGDKAALLLASQQDFVRLETHQLTVRTSVIGFDGDLLLVQARPYDRALARYAKAWCKNSQVRSIEKVPAGEGADSGAPQHKKATPRP